jgi:hypothetical protein
VNRWTAKIAAVIALPDKPAVAPNQIKTDRPLGHSSDLPRHRVAGVDRREPPARWGIASLYPSHPDTINRKNALNDPERRVYARHLPAVNPAGLHGGCGAYNVRRARASCGRGNGRFFMLLEKFEFWRRDNHGTST